VELDSFYFGVSFYPTMQKFLVLIFLMIASQAFSQAVFEWDQSKSIKTNGQNVPIPFSQGINSAQIQTIDLTMRRHRRVGRVGYQFPSTSGF
jgi:hypothetical protein